MGIRRLSALLLAGAVLLSLSGCSTGASQSSSPSQSATSETTEAVTETVPTKAPDNTGDIFVSAYPAFTVTSQSLHDGKWDEATAFEGKDVSPELSWEPVEGASTYVIYMIDMDTGYIIHWKSRDITETTLPEGWAPTAEYTGPAPQPGVTHRYNVYVFALKKPVEKVKGSVRTVSPKVKELMAALDTDDDGNTGNIISVGCVSGKYTGK